MVRQDLTVEVITDTGNTNPTFDALHADGQMFVNTGAEFIVVKNGNASTLTLTITTPQTVAGLAVADRTVTLLTTEDSYIGTFRKDLYDQPSGADAGKVYIDGDIQASVTLMAFRLA
jgi:hypothetical protein